MGVPLRFGHLSVGELFRMLGEDSAQVFQGRPAGAASMRRIPSAIGGTSRTPTV